VRAKATKAGRGEPVAVSITQDSSKLKRVWISPKHAGAQGKDDISLSINLPHYLGSLFINTDSGEVSVTEINSFIGINTLTGNVLIGAVTGEAGITTQSGDVSVSHAASIKVLTRGGTSP
jgi:hypothetical protein